MPTMTSSDRSSALDTSGAAAARRQSAVQRAAQADAPVPCASYREATSLAATRRREGTDAYAFYDTALTTWMVR